MNTERYKEMFSFKKPLKFVQKAMLQGSKKKPKALCKFKECISEVMLVQEVRVYWTGAHFFLPNGNFEIENKY